MSDDSFRSDLSPHGSSSADHVLSNNNVPGDELSEYDEVRKINLKNPVIAGLLTWLLPGAGHYYQKRYAKALLFFLCVVPTFVVGCWLGSSRETGVARNVYYSWREEDKRLAFIPQACLGMAAIPAGIQAMQAGAGKHPIFGRFMAPPQLDENDRSGVPPTTATILAKLHFFIELGKYLTIIAGLMNLLAIFDAMDGPLVYRPEKEDEEENSDEETLRVNS